MTNLFSHSPALTVWAGGAPVTAAEVGITRAQNNRLRVMVSAPHGTSVTHLVLHWTADVPAHARILGDHFERGYGDLEWRGFVPERVLPWYALVFDPQTQTTTGVGVETGANSFAWWRISETGVWLYLDIRNGGSGVHLNGRDLHAATIWEAQSEPEQTPFAFARHFCGLLCPKPRLPPFPIYGGNDWYYAYGNNSDASIRRDAALIRELSPSRDNAPFMVIDAGWFPERGCNGGPYDTGNGNFPDMPGLASAMKEINVRPGIWIRPLLARTVPGAWKLPAAHPIWNLEKGAMVMDASRPDVLEHIRADITRLRTWGYDLIKHDFTTYDLTGRWGFEMADGIISPGAWNFADPTRTTAEIIRTLYQTIREAAGDALLIGCNTVGHLGAGLFEIQRTGDDTSGREWERTRKMGINTLAFRMPQHNTFFAADADCVGITHQIPWDLNRQWLELLSQSGTPLFVSADPAALSAPQKNALARAFALAAAEKPPAEPLDWLHTTAPRTWKFGETIQTFDWTE